MSQDQPPGGYARFQIKSTRAAGYVVLGGCVVATLATLSDLVFDLGLQARWIDLVACIGSLLWGWMIFGLIRWWYRVIGMGKL